MENILVSDFLNTDYKRYAMYVIENRAIASVIDGQKAVNRKILFACEKSAKNDKCKVNVLSGRVIADSQYHHGNVSCEDGIVKMAQKFKNNIPLLQDIGIFGSLRNPYAASSRYISTKMSPIFDYIFKDGYLLEYNQVDGISCEPKFYLPIIPMILVNGSNGIAIGFASNILSRDPSDIIENCIKCLNKKSFTVGEPKISEFSGKFIRSEENHKKWDIRGSYNVIRNEIHITELPPSMTYEKYEQILDDILEKDMIKSYKNNGRGSIHYVVKVNEQFLQQSELEIIKKLKLQEFETENFTTLDENGKLKIFNSAEEIVEYFVSFRLGFYDKRKKYLLDKMNRDANILSNKGRFIKAILDGTLEIKNVSKDVLVENIKKLKILMVDDSYDYLLRMPIWSLTKELFKKLKEDFKKQKEDIESLKKIHPQNMYLNDLLELKEKLK